MSERLFDKQVRDFRGMKFPVLDWGSLPFLYLYGSTGAGKTTIARSYVDRWEGWEVANAVYFIEALKRRAADGVSFTKEIDTLYYAERMVIDDLGSEAEDKFTDRRFNKYSPRDIFETAIFLRHERKLRTIITSNLSPESVGEKGRYGPKVYSRLIEASAIYLFTGDRRLGGEVQVTLKGRGTLSTDTPIFPTPTAPPEKDITKAEAVRRLNALKPEIKALAYRGMKKAGLL